MDTMPYSILDVHMLKCSSSKNNYYYSKSKGLNIKLADMHIDHFFRAFKIDNHQKKSVQDETQEIIQQQKKT